MAHWRQLSSGVWVGEYAFHANTINMLVVDLGERRLAVFSPGTGIDAAAFSDLDALGKVVALVAPGAYHNMGLPSWHARYPEAKLLTTGAGIAHIAKQHPTLPPMANASELGNLAGGALAVYETPGKQGDLLVFVKRADGVTCFSCEYLVNWVDMPSNPIFRWVFAWTKSAPGVRLAKPSAWFLRANLGDVARFCLDKLEAHGATCFVPCHGAVVQGPDTRAQLEQAIRARL